MSVCELLREPVVSAARVLARPRKNGEEEAGAEIGDVGEGSEKAGCDGEIVDVVVGASRIPLCAQICGAGWLFRRNLIGRRQLLAVDHGDNLMLGPGVFVVIEPLPKWS
jgi:hypothetical protein